MITKLNKSVVLILGLFLILFPSVLGATINVPGDQPTITAAIAAASPGDTINVVAGDYNSETFPINVNQALTIQAIGVATGTIINASASNHGAINITADNVVINGFSIKGGGDSSTYEHV